MTHQIISQNVMCHNDPFDGPTPLGSIFYKLLSSRHLIQKSIDELHWHRDCIMYIERTENLNIGGNEYDNANKMGSS